MMPPPYRDAGYDGCALITPRITTSAALAGEVRSGPLTRSRRQVYGHPRRSAPCTVFSESRLESIQARSDRREWPSVCEGHGKSSPGACLEPPTDGPRMDEGHDFAVSGAAWKNPMGYYERASCGHPAPLPTSALSSSGETEGGPWRHERRRTAGGLLTPPLAKSCRGDIPVHLTRTHRKRDTPGQAAEGEPRLWRYRMTRRPNPSAEACGP